MKLRKALKKLEARRKAFDQHGPNPNANPGKENPPMLMHRPGSMKK